MTDIVERARKYSPYDYEPGSQVYREAYLRKELIAEIERLRAEVKQLEDHWDDIAYERNDLKAEIARLKSEPKALQFQPNNRALLRDIIRTLILEIRVLRLELKQRDQQSGR